jgi:hypothetical protein
MVSHTSPTSLLKDNPDPPISNLDCCSKNYYAKIAEIVAISVVSIFSLLSQPVLFVGALSLGALYQIVKIKLNFSQLENGSSKPGCGQGYGEFFSGVKLLPVEVAVVIGALACDHLRMNPNFYIPFFGFFMGWRLVNLGIAFNSPYVK